MCNMFNKIRAFTNKDGRKREKKRMQPPLHEAKLQKIFDFREKFFIVKIMKSNQSEKNYIMLEIICRRKFSSATYKRPEKAPAR